MNSPLIDSPDQTPAATAPATFLSLVIESARTAVGFWPRWARVPESAWYLLLIFVIGVACDIGLGRAYILGAADFYPKATLQLGLSSLLIAWLCYWLRQNDAPSAAQLFTLLIAQSTALQIIISLPFIFIVRAPAEIQTYLDTPTAQWLLWALPYAYIYGLQLLLLWRGSSGQKLKFIVVALLYSSLMVVYFVAEPAQFWYPKKPTSAKDEPKYLKLSQSMMEAQPVLLAAKLAQIQDQRAGVVDMYAIEFAPYADEDVFLREAKMVAGVMNQRFDTGNRHISLINHVDTVTQWPWATPLNLQRSIAAIASKMDKDEDILFIHLTSHGAKAGELAASFWPMALDPVTPEQLKKWLDDAGIRNRVISISACYSGSWIKPLANDNSLIMTAADADHTSYGCGRQSELTFFGRAMFDEQLRNKTLSFETAHAAARKVIQQREIEAGKDDGYSNPQISVGALIREPLAKLQQRLQTPH